MKPSHQVFVNEMLQHGDNVKAYLAAYPKCKPSSARNAANRLLQHPEVEQAIQETKQRIRTEIETELCKKLEEEILSELQIKLLLTKIATGQHEAERTFCLKDGTCETVTVKPTHHQVLRALYMLARMSGMFPPSVGKQPPKPEPQTEQQKTTNPTDTAISKTAKKSAASNEMTEEEADRAAVESAAARGLAPVYKGLPESFGGGSFSEYYPLEYRGCRWDPDDPNTQEQFHGYLIKREQELKQQLTTVQTRLGTGSLRLRELYNA